MAPRGNAPVDENVAMWPRRGRLLDRSLSSTRLVVSHNAEHLALLFPDQLVKRDARLVVVCGLDGAARCPFLCLGQFVIDVVGPRDPLVRVGQASADPKSSGTASTAHYRSPCRSFLARAELAHHRSVAPKYVYLARDGCVLVTHVTRLWPINPS